jgi:DNA-binding transcriptional MocR family regulator
MPPLPGLAPGDPLPSIRPLAEELRVNRNTVAKAYAELESLGIIETIAGKGLLFQGKWKPADQRSPPQAAGGQNRRSCGHRAPDAVGPEVFLGPD